MKIKIGVIYSFSTQKEMIKNIASDLPDEVEVLMENGILEEAIPNAKYLEAQGVEVIISWAGTAKILEKEISIPVVDIKIQDFDIMRAVKQASNFGNKVAILTPWNLNGIDLLEQLYGIKIKQVIYERQNDVYHGAIEAFNEGFEVLIGKSNMPIDIAREYGKKAVLITFNESSLRISFDQALQIAKLRRKEREQYYYLETIFNSLNEGVIVCDNFYKINLYNQAAEKILNIRQNSALAQSIKKILPNSKATQALKDGVNLDDDFLSIQGEDIVASHVPIFGLEGILGLVSTLRKASEIQKIDSTIRKKMVFSGFIAKYRINHFSATSSEMKKIIEKAKKFALTDSTILILGETGTGKEVMAQGLHNFSFRNKRPFVAVNCSVLPDNLLESELFGYEGGAFTGAKKGGKIGLFELAHGGTIFLDEISTMPLGLQSKLLRVIQEREVMRLGGERLIPVNVRIIAASNKELGFFIEKREFREDLYFRLNVLTIRMPPLRKRKKDIPGLLSHYISFYSKKYKKNNIGLNKGTIKKLQDYCWPGNVRQLENFTERFVLLYDGDRSDDLIFEEFIRDETSYQNYTEETNTKAQLAKEDWGGGIFRKTIREEEIKRIIQCLQTNNFNISRSALKLGMSRATLYRKLRNYNIKKS